MPDQDGRDEGDGAQQMEIKEPEPEYRLYRRRWVGLVALVLLNLVSGMCLVWFGPIANDVVAQFGFTIDEVNWLGNVINIVYLPTSALVPYLYGRLGIRRACFFGAFLFLCSAWIRYAGTIGGLRVGGAYTLILIGQIISGVAQPVFQVLIPSYSEKWFDLKGRTTATMLISIANPIGNAIGQLISPLVGDPAQSILVMGIIFSAVTPAVFFVSDAPPTPPTPSAGTANPPFMSLVRAMVGKEQRGLPTYMTVRQRIDFVILSVAFGTLVGIINAFSILSAQIMEPYGYSDTISGLMGATILLVGIVAAGITAPLFDRVLSYRLALSCKTLAPFLGVGWFVLIWAVRANDAGGLFAIFAVIGAMSLTLLPVTIELAVELTRNADGSSAVLWSLSNLFGVVFVLVEGALRADADASPPYNMQNALIFQAVIVCVVVVLVFFLEGRQMRREQDEAMLAAVHRPATVASNSVGTSEGDKKDDAFVVEEAVAQV